MRRIVSPRAAGEDEPRRTLRVEPLRLRIREVSVLRDAGDDGGVLVPVEGRVFELLGGVFLVGGFTFGRFADGRFAVGRFAVGRFAVGRFAVGGFAFGRFAAGRFVFGRSVTGGFAFSRVLMGLSTVDLFLVGFVVVDVVAVGLFLAVRVLVFPAGLLADFSDGLVLGLVRRTDGFLRIDLAPGLMLDALAGRVGSG